MGSTSVEVCETPFQYLIGNHLFSKADCKTLYNWLHNDVKWKLHKEYFFEQFETQIDLDNLPEQIKNILSQQWFENLKKNLSETFHTRFSDYAKICAHRFLPSQGIGLHNDNPIQPAFETHRFIAYINEYYSDEDGGFLVLFNSEDKRDIHRILRPLNNSYFAFAASKTSNHAVTTINSGIRYTLNLSFWDQRFIETERKVFDRIFKKDSTKIYTFFKKQGAMNTSHSNRTAWDHFVGTAAALMEIPDIDEELILAALFHSVYGTSCTESINFTLTERTTIANLIGNLPERLAYLYCMINRRELHALFTARQQGNILLRDSTTEFVDENTLRNLLIIDVANAIEQIPHVSMTTEMIRKEKSFYLNLKESMPLSVSSWVQRNYDGGLETVPGQ